MINEIITDFIKFIINKSLNTMMFFLPDSIKIKIAQKNFKNTRGIGTLFCKKCHSKELEEIGKSKKIFRCCSCDNGRYINDYTINEIENIYRKKYKIKTSNHFLSNL